VQDPAGRERAWTAAHPVGTFKPFSVRAIQQQGGRTLGQTAQSLVGITPAPSNLTHSAERQRQVESGRKVERTPQQKRPRGQ
jgi:hypothetical protein